MAPVHPHYEVEIRCHFKNHSEVYQVMPFLRSCWQQEGDAFDTYYGRQLFEGGYVLRISEVFAEKGTRHYLAWKGQDIGQFANIRQELGEDITAGITNSAILKRLRGKNTQGSTDDVITELKRLGHQSFMSNNGRNLKGRYEPLDINIKLMSWSKLRRPLLLEIEKIANTEKEARQYEKDLQEIRLCFNLKDRLVKEEPPTQLFMTIFG